MDLKEIKAIIDLMTRNSLAEFELERPEFKIRVKRAGNELVPTVTVAPTTHHPAPASATHPTAPAPHPSTPAAAAVSQIVSPMVGTFYRSPSPDSSPYIEIGQAIHEDTVVCIIEAMKVMNEIKAEMKGVVTEVLAENGKAVEFGKPLFSVRPA